MQPNVVADGFAGPVGRVSTSAQDVYSPNTARSVHASQAHAANTYAAAFAFAGQSDDAERAQRPWDVANAAQTARMTESWRREAKTVARLTVAHEGFGRWRWE